jgi:hypothetical protein
MAPSLWTLLILAAAVSAQSVLALSGTATTGRSALGDLPTASVTYLSLSSTVTLSSDLPSTTIISGTVNTRSSASSSNRTITSSTSTHQSLTFLGGGTAKTSTGNGTASSTSSSVRPVNTQPCNGYPEFCNRSYSNITNVAAHNYPFIRKGNTGSNQELPVTDQLNDGIRMRKFSPFLHFHAQPNRPQYKHKSTMKMTHFGIATRLATS